jgi:hypothetical protein
MAKIFTRHWIGTFALCWIGLTSVAQCQIGVSGFRGTLKKVTGNLLLVAADDGSLQTVPFSQNTLSVRGAGGIDLLYPGANVALQGMATAKDKIENARIVLFVAKPVSTDVYGLHSEGTSIVNGVHSAKAAGPDQIPVVICGSVESVSPLVIRANKTSRNVYYFEGEKLKNGSPKLNTFQSAGKSFEVTPLPSDNGEISIAIEFGSLRYAGENARVAATVITVEKSSTPPFAVVTRTQAIDPREIQPKNAKSNRSEPAKAK